MIDPYHPSTILMSTLNTEDEKVAEYSFRPQNFDDYIGQEQVKKTLKMMLDSAVARNKAMDHVLFYGPPGLGKTSLAFLLSQVAQRKLHIVVGGAIEKKADLASLLSNLQTHDILFIDEIHRLPIQVEEILYSAMEDFRLDILVGQGFNATTLKIDLNPFTLIGATTKAGSLSHPLRDRFGAHLHFDFYEEAELVEMLRLHSKRQKLPIDHQALKVMAECSRGTPRIALRLFRRLIDYCCVEKKSLAGIHEVRCCLKLLEIEENGLVRLDRQILEVMDKQFRGGPVGIESLCACLNEDRETIEIVYEPFLLKRGFIARTGKGRVLTEIGKKFLI